MLVAWGERGSLATQSGLRSVMSRQGEQPRLSCLGGWVVQIRAQPSARAQVGYSLGRAAVLISCLLILSACGQTTVVHNVDEREANRIIETLADEGITSRKGTVDTGREVHYTISVSSSKRLSAIKVLNANLLPRKPDRGYGEVFQESGLIPTRAEERAKELSALEGEIERQLKLVEGILAVEVQIVAPPDTALRTTKQQVPPTTAAVTIKYQDRKSVV